MFFILQYDYVENAVEKRTPFREDHLKLAREYEARGELLLGGAFADTVDGAVLVFDVATRDDVERFVKGDPYVKGGLVTRWSLRPWQVVVGSRRGATP